MKLNIAFDIEASGPAAGIHDMISAGLVVVEPSLDRTFYRETAPTHDRWEKGAYDSIGWTRQQHQAVENTCEAFYKDLMEWTASLEADRLVLWSDNPAWDFQWINWLCFRYGDRNPFGHSARRVGDLWAGVNDSIGNTSSWKRFRRTRHTHNALDDAMGTAEGILAIMEQMQRRKDNGYHG